MDNRIAAIALDEWKLPIFERHLTQAGYAFSKSAGVTPDTLLLRVTTPNLQALALVVAAANDEAAAARKHGGRKAKGEA